jgi:hypothetical protein
MSTLAKRNRGEISNNSDSNTEQNIHYQQRPRTFNSNNRWIRSIRANPHPEDGRFAQPSQNYLGQQKQAGSTTCKEMGSQQTSSTEHRFTTTHPHPPPFSIIFMEEVRDNTAMEDLIKYTFEK